MSPIKKALLFIVLYLVCWQVAYTIIFQDLDFALSLEIFILSWTFRSLEMAAFVWYISLALFIFTVLIGVVVSIFRKRSGNAT